MSIERLISSSTRGLCKVIRERGEKGAGMILSAHLYVYVIEEVLRHKSQNVPPSFTKLEKPGVGPGMNGKEMRRSNMCSL